jgi:hypothetical protein
MIVKNDINTSYIHKKIGYKMSGSEDHRETKKRKVMQDKSKDFVEDGMSTTEIRKTVQQIRAYIEKGGAASLEDRIAQLTLDHAFFAERYPVLFELCTRSDFNFNHLNYFLNKRDEIIQDKVSVEEQSKSVGKEWFDKFVDVSKLEKKK